MSSVIGIFIKEGEVEIHPSQCLGFNFFSLHDTAEAQT